MIASPEALPRLSAEQYIDWEREQHIRHELVDGYLYSMTSASLRHDEIAMNIAASLHAHLKGSGCRVYKSDIKVRVANDFYYPDISVRCSDTREDDYAISDPVVIIEVLSPSTQRFDRGDKRYAYRQLPSLREYVLVSQDTQMIEVDRGDGNIKQLSEENDVSTLASLDFALALSDVYA